MELNVADLLKLWEKELHWIIDVRVLLMKMQKGARYEDLTDEEKATFNGFLFRIGATMGLKARQKERLSG